MEKGQPCVVLVKREIDESKMFSALQFSRRIKKNKPTFLATLKLDKEAKEVRAPKAIQEMLEEFKDIVPAELPKALPSLKEDHAIELELGDKPPVFATYGMPHPELEELKR